MTSGRDPFPIIQYWQQGAPPEEVSRRVVRDTELQIQDTRSLSE
jgi:hypothetical protein